MLSPSPPVSSILPRLARMRSFNAVASSFVATVIASSSSACRVMRFIAANWSDTSPGFSRSRIANVSAAWSGSVNLWISVMHVGAAPDLRSHIELPAATHGGKLGAVGDESDRRACFVGDVGDVLGQAVRCPR